MPKGEDLEVSMQNLRAVIHSLRMNNLAFVEPEALDEIEAMIKSLPTPEQLNGLAETPEQFKIIREHVGGILRLIELYSRRDGEYKARYKSRTGLPPRYKILDWRKAMSTEIRSGLVKDLVKLSGEADEEGLYKLAKSLLVCAKSVKNGELPVEELLEASTNYLREAGIQSKFVKTAQGLPALRDPSLGGIRKGLEQIQTMFAQIQQAFTEKLQYLYQSPKTQKFVQQLGKIWQGVSKLEQATGQQIDALQQPMAQIEEAMEQTLIPQSIMFQNKPTKIEWVPDPDDPGMEMAIINVNGQQYEVQSDDMGNLSVVPQAVAEPVAPQAVPETSQQAETAPVVNETSSQGQTLQDLNRSQLSTMIRQALPDVWQSGYNGQAIANLTDDQMREVLQRGIGAKSLPSFINSALQQAASDRVFNLKRNSSKK